jgi:tripartite-type tricarboxylate transporter receptor subunit TctC
MLMSKVRIALVIKTAALSIFTVLGLAHAEYPDKPIRVVVPWPAGGGSDVVARAVAGPLAEQLKQSVVIDNRPGANGGIGSLAVARAPADGYTLIWVTADTHAMNPHVYTKLGYDPRSDFAAIGLVGYFPYALIVNAGFPANNVAEFAAEAKKNPGKVTFASWGVGGSAHIAMEMFRSQGQFDVLHVPYTGAAPAIAAVAGGQVDSMIVPMSVAGPQAAGGKVKILGIASGKRFTAAPDLKTFAEQGVPVDAGTWVGFMAPANTPQAVVQHLNRAIANVMSNPKVREQLIKMNVDPAPLQTADQFKTFVSSEYDRWGKVIRGANIRVD